MSRILCIVVITLMAGCGFQMQGALSTPAAMERTYIAAGDLYSPFYRALRAELQDAGVQLVDTAAESTATFSISYDETDQRVLSVSARNVPTEYEVYYTIQYTIDGVGSRLLETQDLTITRNYTYDSRLVLGKASEEELLRAAIVKDLVRIVLKQIAAM